MKKNVTCGILLHTRDGYLLCHPTGRPKESGCYDIPKGMKEPGETEWECAVREMREETGLEITAENTVYTANMGRHSYNSKKDIHLFCCEIPDVDVESLACTSMVEELGIPEVDDWLVTEDLGMCFRSLVKVFGECGIPLHGKV